MNVNKEKFINYKKKTFKEDKANRIVNGNNGQRNNSGTSSTQSEENIRINGHQVNGAGQLTLEKIKND